jgi:uncharacterized membrane protein
MTTTSTHPLVADYVRRLERAARVLPRHQRDELVAEIRDHLDAGINPDATEADVRNLLDDLGPPEAIVAAARPEGAKPLPDRGPREVLALIMLVTGLPMFLVGWFIGVGLLLWSPLWTARQKLLGILVFPGGYFVTVMVSLLRVSTSTGKSHTEVCSETTSGGVTNCVEVVSGSSGPSLWPTLLLVVLVVGPLVMAGHLYRAAGRRAALA